MNMSTAMWFLLGCSMEANHFVRGRARRAGSAGTVTPRVLRECRGGEATGRANTRLNVTGSTEDGKCYAQTHLSAERRYQKRSADPAGVFRFDVVPAGVRPGPRWGESLIVWPAVGAP